MAYVNCTEVNELRWNDVCVGVGTTINNNNHGAGVSDDNDVRPVDFMTLCRVIASGIRCDVIRLGHEVQPADSREGRTSAETLFADAA